MRENTKRLAALLLGCALTLALLEAGLQAGARLASRFGGRATPVLEAGETFRILCVGDSHTYGTNVERSESYPAQLQAGLEEGGAAHFEVVNLGVPWPGGFCTRWTTNEVSWSHRILQSQSTSRAWSHCSPYPPRSCVIPNRFLDGIRTAQPSPGRRLSGRGSTSS